MNKPSHWNSLPLFIAALLLTFCSHVVVAEEKPLVPPLGAATQPFAPAELPGNGLLQHDFFYSGESRVHRMYIVREGKVVWSYVDEKSRGEISDAVLMSSGNIVFAHQFGVTEITPEKTLVWNYDAPAGAETHTAIPIGKDRILFVQNGAPAFVRVVNVVTGATEKQFELPVGNPKSVHPQFRHVRLTPAGTLLVPHMDMTKVSEYDSDGKEIWSVPTTHPWSAVPLKNDNVLITTSHDVHEVNRKGETIWTLAQADVPEFKLLNLQIATRLPNGNTLINNWANSWSMKVDKANAPVQALEFTPDKKVVWALRSWSEPADLGPATTIQLLDDPNAPAPEDVHFGPIR
jgi:hypothetical protein